jgi:hypothetical protein
VPAAAEVPTATGTPAAELPAGGDASTFPSATPAPEVSALPVGVAPQAAPAGDPAPVPAADPAADGAPAPESGPAQGGGADPGQARWPDDKAPPGTDPAAW